MAKTRFEVMRNTKTLFILAIMAFTFYSCADEEILESVRIDSVRISELPVLTDDGDAWDDDGTDPDIYIIVKNGGQRLVTSEVMQDTIITATLNFTEKFPVTATQIREGVSIDVWEDDSSEGEDGDDDFIGSVSFVPEFYSGDDCVLLIRAPENIDIKVFTSWNYQ